MEGFELPIEELAARERTKSRLAVEIGVPLETIARANLDKLADRAQRGVIGGDGDKR